MVNVRYDGDNPMERADFQAAIADADAKMGDAGRILVRASGTEPLIRIMAESDDGDLVDTVTLTKSESFCPRPKLICLPWSAWSLKTRNCQQKYQICAAN